MPIVQQNSVDLFPRYARLSFNLFPRKCRQRGEPLLDPFAVVAQEGFVVSLELHDPLGNAVKQRQIAANVRLNVGRCDLRPEQQAPRIARHAEVDHAGFDHRIDADDAPTAVADLHQRRHEPGMIARRIPPDDKHQIGTLHVFERDGGRPRAE
jgi:hypothetical protein